MLSQIIEGDALSLTLRWLANLCNNRCSTFTLLAAVSRTFHWNCCHAVLGTLNSIAEGPGTTAATLMQRLPWALYGSSLRRINAVKQVMDDGPLHAWAAHGLAAQLDRHSAEFCTWAQHAKASGALRSVAAVSPWAVSPTRFRDEFIDASVPALLEGLAEEWPARQSWHPQALFEAMRDEPAGLRCGEDDDGQDVLLSIADYLAYILAQGDDTPLYFFDFRFGEQIPGLLEGYRPPVEYFPEDLMALMGSERPPFRWFLMGPRGSGADVHVDPPYTCAWNALLHGCKRWALIDPGLSADDVGVGTVPDDAPSLEWFGETLQKLVEAHPGKVQTVDQHAGDVLFIPPGWWHVTWNLGDINTAVTHNFVTRATFQESLRSIEECEDLQSAIQDLYGLLDQDQAARWLDVVSQS